MLRKCDKVFKDKSNQLKNRYNRKLKIRTQKRIEETKPENDDF